MSETPPQVKTAAYIRVSTYGQNHAGQRAAIDAWLNEPAEYYVDTASGKDFDRPEFKRLCADIQAGKIDTVVVYKIDRLGRNMLDGLKVLGDWLDRGVRVVSITQQFDFSGTIGKMVAALLLGIAEMERENIRRRQADGIAVARQNGVYQGRQPGSAKASASRACELAERGLTQKEIASALGVSERTVRRYLR